MTTGRSTLLCFSVICGMVLFSAGCVSPFGLRGGREYHVSIHGNDANGGSAADPLRTISEAARLARPGETITVHEGTYREWVRPPRGGTGEDTRITYRAPAERTTLEVYRNYQTALLDAGFEILFECKTEACGARKFTHAAVSKQNYMDLGESYGDFRYLAAKRARPGEGDAYIGLFVAMAAVGGGANYERVLIQLDVVELAAMETRMVTVDASEMATQISASGRVAIYGIYFDFDKADLKPESKPTLDEIAKLLDGQPDLDLVVVGHTDNVGSLDHNMSLSKQRAAAVERALVRDYGVEAARLTSWGIGYLSPVASNQSEDGRVLNRRVELVER